MEIEEPPELSKDEIYKRLVIDLMNEKSLINLEKEDIDKKEELFNYINNIVNI